MIRSRILVLVAASSLLSFACSSSSSSGDVGDSGDASETAHCCPPDPRPSCCMIYGGWSDSPGACAETCDGMPLSSDPAWRLVKDDHGCDTWSAQGSAGPVCGAPLVDSGHDTALDAPGDASDGGDAPACPATQPLRHDPCSDLGQVCFYGCGVVMRCTADGWDFDTTIDGGPPCP